MFASKTFHKVDPGRVEPAHARLERHPRATHEIPVFEKQSPAWIDHGSTAPEMHGESGSLVIKSLSCGHISVNVAHRVTPRQPSYTPPVITLLGSLGDPLWKKGMPRARHS